MSYNVSLRLTDEAAVLATLEKNGALRARGPLGKDRKPTGTKTYVVKHDAVAYEFEPGKIITVNDDVARGLYAQGILFGGSPTEWAGTKFESALDAAFIPVLEIIEKWPTNQEQPSLRKSRKTTCPICGNDQVTVERLKNHILECEEDQAAIQEAKESVA